MSAKLNLQSVNENQGFRGFANLFSKENAAWWGSRRWWLTRRGWVNTLLWTLLICGLMAIMIFGSNEEILEATEAEIAQAGGITGYVLAVGLSVFFEFGMTMLAIGTVVLANDLIIGEKQSGAAEWLLSKPVARRAYILAKLAANALPILILLVGLPSMVGYGILSLRGGTLFPPVPFFSAVGMLTVHTLFYLALTLMLGTIFNSRGLVLGIALASALGGAMLAGFIPQLIYVTPWTLPKIAWWTATGQAFPVEMAIASLAASVVWIIAFIFAALAKFEKMEF